jgi:Arc/MetJ family transcription regulator
MGRTNIVIDHALVREAMQLVGASSMREAVDIALRRLVEKGTIYRSVRRLKGKAAWEGDIDGWRIKK